MCCENYLRYLIISFVKFQTLGKELVVTSVPQDRQQVIIAACFPSGISSSSPDEFTIYQEFCLIRARPPAAFGPVACVLANL